MLSGLINTFLLVILSTVIFYIVLGSAAARPDLILQYFVGAAVGTIIMTGIGYLVTLFASVYLAHRIIVTDVDNAANLKVSGIYTGVSFVLGFVAPMLLMAGAIGSILADASSSMGDDMNVEATDTSYESMDATEEPAMDSSTGGAENDQALDDYEALVVAYEQLTENNPICLSDVTQFNTEALPKLNSFASNMQSNSTLDAEQMNRLTGLLGRMQAAAMKLSEAEMSTDC